MNKNLTGILLATLLSKQEKENKILKQENEELKKNDLYEALKIMFWVANVVVVVVEIVFWWWEVVNLILKLKMVEKQLFLIIIF